MPNITIKDIAIAAGVSHPTVSKALNNSPGVNAKTRERILKLAKQMDYVPNFAAKSLVNKRNRSIGLIWPEVEGLFFYHLCATLQKEARKRNIDVFVSMSKPSDALRNFNEHFIDYVICWLMPDWMPSDEFIKEKELFKGQITVIGGGKTEGVNLISIDRGSGIFNAVQYLAGMGHKRIAFVGQESDKNIGYMKGVLENKLEYDSCYMITTVAGFYYGSSKRKELEERFTKLWKGESRPTALILDSQGSAFAMINVLLDLGIVIPDELSIVAYDDIPELSIYPVALDTCSPSIQKIITLVLDDYENRFSQEAAQTMSVNTITPELIIRESSRRI